MDFIQENLQDLIGDRGHAIFTTLITRRHPVHGHIFRAPRYLGDKMPAIDAYVEANTASPASPFFLAQVKTTTRGYTTRGRLKVSVSAEYMRRLSEHVAPTYLVGIDEPGEQGFIVSANAESTGGVASMCTDHPLEPDVIAALYSEVAAFWDDASEGVKSALVDQNREQP